MSYFIHRSIVIYVEPREERAYNFPIEKMLFDHDNVDSLWVSESKKAKSSAASCSGVSHNCTFLDLSILGEVVFQGF